MDACSVPSNFFTMSADKRFTLTFHLQFSQAVGGTTNGTTEELSKDTESSDNDKVHHINFQDSRPKDKPYFQGQQTGYK